MSDSKASGAWYQESLPQYNGWGSRQVKGYPKRSLSVGNDNPIMDPEGGGNPDQRKKDRNSGTRQRNKIRIQKWQNKITQFLEVEWEIGLDTEAGQNSALDVSGNNGTNNKIDFFFFFYWRMDATHYISLTYKKV